MPAGAPALDAIGHAMLGLMQLARMCCVARLAIGDGTGFGVIWLTLAAAWHTQAAGAREDRDAAAGASHRSDEAYGPQAVVFCPNLSRNPGLGRYCRRRLAHRGHTGYRARFSPTSRYRE
ncbi:hypothetical protein MBOT_22290 [Mycobacterium botniense]|uniref:Uncharacterized protein n=1 Tax=Mycobacterium botniense TaxID=84962 RepID=A0A7I9XYH7_9MYCO|nr:hypothetical protein MBOT_22290 [Mycobacterium botniense]